LDDFTKSSKFSSITIPSNITNEGKHNINDNEKYVARFSAFDKPIVFDIFKLQDIYHAISLEHRDKNITSTFKSCAQVD
jgi:hypothetical protein